MTTAVQLLIGTRKGAWIYCSDAARRDWSVTGPIFLGQIVNHFVVDPRGGGTMLMAAKTGHLGPTIFRSTDAGATWTEAARPPAFPKSTDPQTARAVEHTFWLEAGHADEPGVWWAGASPPGLFVSHDDGVNWESVAGFNDHPMYHQWVPSGAGTPDGPFSTRSPSTRATRSTCISPPPPAECSKAMIAPNRGRRSTRAWR